MLVQQVPVSAAGVSTGCTDTGGLPPASFPAPPCAAAAHLLCGGAGAVDGHAIHGPWLSAQHHAQSLPTGVLVANQCHLPVSCNDTNPMLP
jgi:hypothetical protein